MSYYDLAPKSGGNGEGKPLTGWTVLAILVAFFGVVASVNGVMIYSALSTFSGEVETHPYEHGLAYNRDIAAARAQAARAWKVEATVTRAESGEARILVVARDAKGADVIGAELTATLASPVDTKQDVRASLKETVPGRYEGGATVGKGLRDLDLTATLDGRQVFRSRSRLQID